MILHISKFKLTINERGYTEHFIFIRSLKIEHVDEEGTERQCIMLL